MASGEVKTPRARVVAFYLPQFHVTPENDLWWGRDFTDWVNVRAAKPLFEGHYQPRLPLNGNYYDLTSIDVMRWQISLARDHGMSGFCHYHYWFDGRQLLQRPTELMLSSRDLGFPFCLAWINSSWSRRWRGNSEAGQVLVRQTYSSTEAAWMKHFDYLFRFWSDDRQLQVDGKPVFLIYNPHDVPRVEGMLNFWRREAERRGIPGLHVVAMQHFPFLSERFLQHFDALVEVQPSVAMFVRQTGDRTSPSVSIESFLRGLPWGIGDRLTALRHRLPRGLRLHDYDTLWSRNNGRHSNRQIPVYPGAFVDWDNTARYGRGARVVVGATPQRFAHWLGPLVDSVKNRSPDHRLIFMNAWNEWAEGAYLEPDERYGLGYLEALRHCVLGQI